MMTGTSCKSGSCFSPSSVSPSLRPYRISESYHLVRSNSRQLSCKCQCCHQTAAWPWMLCTCDKHFVPSIWQFHCIKQSTPKQPQISDAIFNLRGLCGSKNLWCRSNNNNLVWGPVPHLPPGSTAASVADCTIPHFLNVPPLSARCLSRPHPQ